MCNKLTYLLYFILILGLISTGNTNAKLVGWWKLDETSGTIAADSSGNGLDGTLQGDINWVTGQIGGAWQGDGSNDYIDLGDDAATGGLLDLSVGGQATVAAWINMASSKNHNSVLTKGEWRDAYGITIKGDTNPPDQVWVGGRDTILSGEPVPVGEWTHIAQTIDGTAVTIYINGGVVATATRANTISNNPNDHVEIGREDRSDDGSSARWYFNGMIDDVQIYDEALPAEMIMQIMIGDNTRSSAPYPDDGAKDVLRDSVLSWTPGEFADKHDVYFGTNFDDVNAADTGSPLLVSPAQDANTYNPGRLELGWDYYWRVDEVNAPPDLTVFKGDVWSFRVEPFAIPIPGESIIVTASGYATSQGPEKTIDGSGLVDEKHSIAIEDMWLSAPGEPGSAWIKYEFDQVCKLDHMLVWNYNAPSFLAGLGLKEVAVEYSIDDDTWSQLENVGDFNSAPGTDKYASDIMVDLDGVAAKYIKITAISNHAGGGFFNQYGLSEVRFMVIPVSARQPSPDDGATDVAVDVTLGWRAGRDAAEHNVYVSTDQQAVIDGTALFSIVTEASSGPLSLDLDSTYYWRVDEVNGVDTWQGNTWSFTTQEYLVVDDFELYTDDDATGMAVWQTWTDGYGVPANGSTIGYPDPAFLSGEHYMETTTRYGGMQSAPLFYDNTTANMSEVTVNTSKLPIGQDWSIGSPQTLELWIHGDPGNAATDQLYVKVGNFKKSYDGDISRPQWKPMIIDLAALGVNLNNVSSLSIGLERVGATGGSGIVYIDEIRLYRTAPAVSAEEIWIEAEAADSITPPMMIFSDIPGASGGQYISNSADAPSAGSAPQTEGIAQYNFTVTGGTYVIWGRVSVPDNAHDSFWLRIQGATVDRTVHSSGWVQWNNIPVGDDWHWDDVHSSQDGNNTVNWTLTAGMHTLEIGYRDSSLDALVITKVD